MSRPVLTPHGSSPDRTPFRGSGSRTVAGVGLSLLCRLLAGCGAEGSPPQDEEPRVRYPIGLAADPSGARVYAVGANFDRKYRAGVLRAIDTATDRFVADAVQEVPGFAGGLALQVVDGQPPRLVVPARGDDSVSLIRIGSSPPFSCGADDVGRCNPSYRLSNDKTSSSGIGVGDDPIGVFVEPLGGGAARLHVVATSDGQVTVVDLAAAPTATAGAAAPPVAAALVDRFTLVTGLSAVVAAPLSGRSYVTSSRSRLLRVYRIGALNDAKKPYGAILEPSIELPASRSRDFGRGMALSADGSRVYVAWRSPDALVVLDVAPNRAGVPRNAVVDVIGIGREPAQVALATLAPDREIAYVSCFGEDAVWAVDVQQRAVVGVMRLAFAPHALSAVKTPAGWKLYATLFEAHTIVALPLTADGRFVAGAAIVQVKP